MLSRMTSRKYCGEIVNDPAVGASAVIVTASDPEARAVESVVLHLDEADH